MKKGSFEREILALIEKEKKRREIAMVNSVLTSYQSMANLTIVEKDLNIYSQIIQDAREIIGIIEREISEMELSEYDQSGTKKTE